MVELDILHCRRSDFIGAALVEAAIVIQRAHGYGAGRHLLELEGMPNEVIDRVLFERGAKRAKLHTMLPRPKIFSLHRTSISAQHLNLGGSFGGNNTPRD